MTKAFVDTSVLTDALLKPGSVGDLARSGLSRFDETQLPVYAIKEFKAGPFAYTVWLYNKFVTEKSYARVLTAVHAVQRTLQRNRAATAIEALAGLADVLGQRGLGVINQKYNANISMDALSAEENRIALKSIIYKAWARRRAVTTKVVCPLPCYAELDLKEEASGCLVIGPRKCTLPGVCSMQKDLIAKPDHLAALRDVAKAGARAEDQRRYQVLRALHRTPNRRIDSDACRNLGDAVFAFFAPSDTVILTTNVKDHEPLAAALGKAVEPP